MKKASALVEEFPEKFTREKVPIRDLMEEFENRSLILVILILALPNLLPFVNALGITQVTSFLLLFFTIQMIRGSVRPWLPKRILNYEIKRERMIVIANRASRVLRFIEKHIKTRYETLADEKFAPVYGFILFLLAFALFLPIPLFNVPPALIMIFMLLGYLQRDGLVLIISTLAAVISLTALSYALYVLGLYIIA